MLKIEKKYISHFPKNILFKENEISNNPEEKLILTSFDCKSLYTVRASFGLKVIILLGNIP